MDPYGIESYLIYYTNKQSDPQFYLGAVYVMQANATTSSDTTSAVSNNYRKLRLSETSKHSESLGFELYLGQFFLKGSSSTELEIVPTCGTSSKFEAVGFTSQSTLALAGDFCQACPRVDQDIMANSSYIYSFGGQSTECTNCAETKELLNSSDFVNFMDDHYCSRYGIPDEPEEPVDPVDPVEPEVPVDPT